MKPQSQPDKCTKCGSRQFGYWRTEGVRKAWRCKKCCRARVRACYQPSTRLPKLRTLAASLLATGLSVKDVAREVGLSWPTVNKVKKGFYAN